MRFKKIIIMYTLLMLSFLLGWCDEIEYEKLKLGLSIPKKAFFGEDIKIIVTLKSDIEQSVVFLDTADIVISIKDIKTSKIEYYSDRGSLNRYCNVKKKMVKIQIEDELSLTINYLSEVKSYYTIGEYTVEAVYEGKVLANAKLTVEVDYERTIPAIINWLASPKTKDKRYIRSVLFALIGKPAWVPSETDTKEKIESEVKALRQWWDENKESILMVELNFKPELKEIYDLMKLLNRRSLIDSFLKEKIISIEDQNFYSDIYKAVQRLGELEAKKAIPILIELLHVRDTKYSITPSDTQVDFLNFPFAVALSKMGEDACEPLLKEISASDIKTTRFQLSCLTLQKILGPKKAAELSKENIATEKNIEAMKFLKMDIKNWHVKDCSDFKIRYPFSRY